MVMFQPWVGLLSLLAVVAGIVAVTVRRRRRRAQIGDRPSVANVELAAAAPAFRQAHKRYVFGVGLELAAAGALVLTAGGMLARPGEERVDPRQPKVRDIMLCLDVSGSMADIDVSLLERFRELASKLHGDRIGMTIWDSSAVSVFPLTDDMDYVEEQLDEAVRAMNEFDYRFFAGTFNGDGSSLIGDGLASCVGRFDRQDEERNRTLVLATDNQLSGNPILSLDEAAALTKSHQLTVHVVAPDYGYGFAQPELEELKQVAASTGGVYYPVDFDDSASKIADAITKREGTETELPPQLVRNDRQSAWVALGLAITAALAALGWVIRR